VIYCIVFVYIMGNFKNLSCHPVNVCILKYYYYYYYIGLVSRTTW